MMGAAKIIEHEMDCQHVLVILKFLAVAVRKASESPVVHAEREILAFNVAGGYESGVCL